MAASPGGRLRHLFNPTTASQGGIRLDYVLQPFPIVLLAYISTMCALSRWAHESCDKTVPLLGFRQLTQAKGGRAFLPAISERWNSGKGEP